MAALSPASDVPQRGGTRQRTWSGVDSAAWRASGASFMRAAIPRHAAAVPVVRLQHGLGRRKAGRARRNPRASDRTSSSTRIRPSTAAAWTRRSKRRYTACFRRL